MFQYRPERIIIDQAVSAEPLTEQICERFPEVPTQLVENFAWHQDETGADPLRNPLTQGKKTLHLKYFKGTSIKACTGFSNELICCNYFTLDFSWNDLKFLVMTRSWSLSFGAHWVRCASSYVYKSQIETLCCFCFGCWEVTVDHTEDARKCILSMVLFL